MEFGGGIELPFPSRAVEWLVTTRPCTTLKARAASASLPTLFPSSTGSRLSPSSSRGAIHDMAQTGRSNVRYVDPQRRYTVVLGPSWNAPFEALPHDGRAGTHDSADGRCGSYASTGRGQSPRSVNSVEKFLSIRARRRIEYPFPAPRRADLPDLRLNILQVARLVSHVRDLKSDVISLQAAPWPPWRCPPALISQH